MLKLIAKHRRIAILAALAMTLALSVASIAATQQAPAPAWPLRTVPEDLWTNAGRAPLIPASSDQLKNAAVTKRMAEQTIAARYSGSKILESALVLVWSDTSNGASTSRGQVLAWAVSMMPQDGIQCRGCEGQIHDQEFARVRAAGDTRPLTDAEAKSVASAAAARVLSLRASVVDPYDIEFINATTGEWIGGASGARSSNANRP